MATKSKPNRNRTKIRTKKTTTIQLAPYSRAEAKKRPMAEMPNRMKRAAAASR